MPNWAEQVTAIATVIGAIGLLSAIGAAIFAGRQVEESRIGRQAEVVVEFFRRWNDDALAETRRLVASYRSKEDLRDALVEHVRANNREAYVLFRELDYFEQLGALEAHGAFSFEVIESLLGQRLVDRWQMWRPAIEAIGGSQTYPLFERLAKKMEAALTRRASLGDDGLSGGEWQDGAMTATDSRIEVQRTIPADAASIFRVLRDPNGHVAIDSSGMLMEGEGKPASAVGDTFVIHMDREALNDFPMGKYDVTVVITKYEPDREIAWTIEGQIKPALGHVYGYTLEPVDGGTLVTSYYDWSDIDPTWKEAAIFPIIPESALRGTLGILDRTVRRGAF